MNRRSPPTPRALRNLRTKNGSPKIRRTRDGKNNPAIPPHCPCNVNPSHPWSSHNVPAGLMFLPKGSKRWTMTRRLGPGSHILKTVGGLASECHCGHWKYQKCHMDANSACEDPDEAALKKMIDERLFECAKWHFRYIYCEKEHQRPGKVAGRNTWRARKRVSGGDQLGQSGQHQLILMTNDAITNM
jgi:hypothetical protein